MHSNEKLLLMLSSPKASVRYEACEWLRISQESTPEIVIALEKSSHDPNKEVAERASLALQADVNHQMAITCGVIEPDAVPEGDGKEQKFDPFNFGEEHATEVEELKAYVGPGWEDYLIDWKPAIVGTGKAGGFNISGLFFSTLWLSYRKMYWIALLFYAFFGLVSLAELIYVQLTGKLASGLVGFGGCALLAIMVGIFGNRWYFNQAQRAISNIHAGDTSTETACQLLAKRGGRSIWPAIGLYAGYIVTFSVIYTISMVVLNVVTPSLPGLSSAEKHYSLGMDNYNNGNMENSIREFTAAIQLKPGYIDAYINRGNAYYQNGDLESAMSDYNQAMKLDSHRAETYNNRGNVYVKQGDLDSAIAEFDQAIQINPQYATAYLNRGNAYADLYPERAISDYQQAIEIDPDFIWAYKYRAVFYLNRNQMDNAISDLDQAIRIDPNDVAAYYNRGLAYLQKGESELALTDFEKADTLDPSNPDIYFKLGYIHYLLNEKDKAITNWEKVIQIRPDDAAAHYNLGLVYNEQGNTEKAFSEFKKGLDLCGTDTELCQKVQSMLQELGEN